MSFHFTGSCSAHEYYNVRYAPLPGSGCASFCQCATLRTNPDGTIDYHWVEQPCARGTLWDQTLLTCDHAYNVNCQGSVFFLLTVYVKYIVKRYTPDFYFHWLLCFYIKIQNCISMLICPHCVVTMNYTSIKLAFQIIIWTHYTKHTCISNACLSLGTKYISFFMYIFFNVPCYMYCFAWTVITPPPWPITRSPFLLFA